MISLGALVPHPPVMAAGVGQPDHLSQVAETIQSMQALDRMLSAEDPPETLVVFTPHGSVFRDAIIIYGEPVLSGNLRQFGLARTGNGKPICRWPNHPRTGDSGRFARLHHGPASGGPISDQTGIGSRSIGATLVFQSRLGGADQISSRSAWLFTFGRSYTNSVPW